MQEEVLEEILRCVEKPARYTGGEVNMIVKDPARMRVRFAFAFPDTYEVGMSHLGGKILYEVMNRPEDVYCERVYAPWPDMERQLRLAEVNHCLSFEQVSDELIEDYNISDGTFDTVVECRYTVPSFTSIGRLYQGVVLSTMKNDDAAQAILDVFSFFISDEISDFNSNVYYTNPDYIRYCYLEGEMLA